MSVLATDIGLEKQCRSCGEYWPADGEFFGSDRSQPDGLKKICRACYWELPSTQARRKRQEQRP